MNVMRNIVSTPHMERQMMNFDQLERFVEALPDKMMIGFFGKEVECELDEFGMQANGYYVVLNTTSPEGYDTKFVLFDAEILVTLGKA